MKRCVSYFSIFFLVTLFFLPTIFGQETGSAITLNFPEDEVTYGPWSETYFDYPRTGGKAHHLRLNVSVSENVAYYRIMRNNEWVQYVGNMTMQDAVSDNSIIEFKPDDLEPLDLIGYLSAFQNVTVVAYDVTDNELGRDSAIFYIAVNLDDYYELLSSEGEQTSSYVVRQEDLDSVSVSQQEYQTSSTFFTVKKYVTTITVRNKFTGEEEEHTRIRLSVKPAIASAIGKEVSLYAVLPKEVVAHLNNLTLAGNYSVLDVDPVMMWHFSAVDTTQTVEYDVNLPLNTAESEEIVPIIVSDIEDVKSQWYFYIPLVIPVILLFSIVYFSRFKKKEK